MSSRCPETRLVRLALVVAVAIGAASALPAVAAERRLRVCAEPDNLPLSTAHETGFENRIARVVADELGAELLYEWQPQRRGFVRKTIGADVCDAWMGVPAGFERLLTTRPYYRSRYVFLNRADASEPLRSFADPRLATLRIGIQLIGNDLAATPPAHALARAGATANVVGYNVYGDGSAAERIGADLAAGRLDAALVWGPQAGYFTDHLGRAPGDHAGDRAARLRAAVRLRDRDRRAQGRRRPAPRPRCRARASCRDIDAILDAYHVPRIAEPTSTAAATAPSRP
jgi:quinoprotein dehydrogenase-associated probable ABC transporter substrate-binding protein